MNLYIFNFKYKKKRIIYLLFLLLILFFLFDRIVFFAIREISNDFYKSLKSDVFGKKITKKEKEFYDTLIFGTSRTMQGIHPFYLKEYLGLNSYKEAGAGKYFKYNYLFYKKFKKKYKTPKYLIYGFDYFIFGQKSGLFKLNRLLGRRKKKNTKMDFNINRKNKSVLSYLSLLYRKKNEIDNFFIDFIDFLSKTYSKKDSIGLISKFTGKKITVSKDDQKEPLNWKKSKFPKFPGQEGEYLVKLFNELKKDRVTVFIVILPDYINVYKTNYEHKLFEIEVKKICDEYSNIKIISYNSPDKFNLSNHRFFKDGKFGSRNSHLSYYGAKVLNEKLCKDISSFISK